MKLFLDLFALLGTSEKLKKTPWSESASELYRPAERPPLAGEVSANFCG
jgi:hypothetical protein